MMATADEWSPYPDPNRPPPPPDASVVSHKARFNPLGRALTKALTALAEEDEPNIDDGSSSAEGGESQNEESDADSTGKRRGRKRPRRVISDSNNAAAGSIGSDDDEPAASASGSTTKLCVDAKMKEHLLQSFGDAVAKTDWHGQDNVREGQLSNTLGAHPAANAPAGLLRGNIKHYNRFGRQWRILVEDVQIRPRVRLEKRGSRPNRRRGSIRRSERQSLWDRSLEHDRGQIRSANATDETAGVRAATSSSSSDTAATAEAAATATSSSSSNDTDVECLNIEGNTIRIKGDVLILAYDDV